MLELFRILVFLINISKAQNDRNNVLNYEIYGQTLLQQPSFLYLEAPFQPDYCFNL
jgi:hypothetical protein